MRIGVFGGTFDPVHESHIQMGLDALEQCHLDKVFFVPTRPWQKTARASEEDRAAMLSMALTSYQDKLVRAYRRFLFHRHTLFLQARVRTRGSYLFHHGLGPVEEPQDLGSLGKIPASLQSFNFYA